MESTNKMISKLYQQGLLTTNALLKLRIKAESNFSIMQSRQQKAMNIRNSDWASVCNCIAEILIFIYFRTCCQSKSPVNLEFNFISLQSLLSIWPMSTCKLNEGHLKCFVSLCIVSLQTNVYGLTTLSVFISLILEEIFSITFY